MPVLVIASVLSEAYKSLSADRISYFAYNAESDELQCIISKDIKGTSIPKSAGYVGQAFETGKVVNAREVKEAHYKFVDEKVGYTTKTVLCAPLFDSNGNKVGVIQAVNKLNNECFIDVDEKRIQDISSILSMYINVETDNQTDNSKRPSWYKSFDILNEIVDTIKTSVVPNIQTKSRHLPRLELIRRDLAALANDIRKNEETNNEDSSTRDVKLVLSNSELDTLVPSNIFTWDFNSTEITESPRLCAVIMKLVQSLPALPEGLNVEVLGSYVQRVSCSYNAVPFHNFQHATCVTHALYMFIKETNVDRFLHTNRTFGLLLSAVIHDVDHPGNTNTFEINTGSDLAAIYNDKSVLENHHCSTAFRLMRGNSCGVLSSLSSNDARDIRKAVVAAVLATDMAVHFQMVGEMAQKAPKNGEELQYDEEGDKLFLCSILLHTADLSNPYRRFDMTQEWAKRVAEEFNNQIAKEKELGLPFLPYMATPDEMSLCRNEIGFGSHVVMPYVKNLALLFPELSYIQSSLTGNIEKWKEKLAELSKAGNNGDS